MENKTVVVIGAGPAGIAASIQLKRSGIDFILLEKDNPGGLLRNANSVENYPGFPDGITGPELVYLMHRHLTAAGVDVIKDEARSLSQKNGEIFVQTRKRFLTARHVIIATGTQPKTAASPEIPGNMRGRVFSDIHRIMHSKNRSIAIIGAGDAAFDYGLSLVDHNRVTIINRGMKTRCLSILKDKYIESKNGKYMDNTLVRRVSESKGEAFSLECQNIHTGERFSMMTEYLVFAIGRKPALDFLDPSITQNLTKLKKSNSVLMAGDVHKALYRQTGIAVGDGIEAAMRIHTMLGVH